MDAASRIPLAQAQRAWFEPFNHGGNPSDGHMRLKKHRKQKNSDWI
jgi:hypothetical protein